MVAACFNGKGSTCFHFVPVISSNTSLAAVSSSDSFSKGALNVSGMLEVLLSRSCCNSLPTVRERWCLFAVDAVRDLGGVAA